ncbi:MAG: metalloregulator ArsR/SmtB family transcription factor [Vicinamibacteria bacterium]
MRKTTSEVERLAELDAVVAALAHPSRRQILLVVHFRGGEMTAGEIADRFSCAWPTVSRHLRVLERAELVVHEKRGRTRVYRLNRRKLSVVKDWLRWFDKRSP